MRRVDQLVAPDLELVDHSLAIFRWELVPWAVTAAHSNASPRWLVSNTVFVGGPKNTTAQDRLCAPISVLDVQNDPISSTSFGWFCERHQPPRAPRVPTCSTSPTRQFGMGLLIGSPSEHLVDVAGIARTKSPLVP